jgi:hypothetical protein
VPDEVRGCGEEGVAYELLRGCGEEGVAYELLRGCGEEGVEYELLLVRRVPIPGGWGKDDIVGLPFLIQEK